MNFVHIVGRLAKDPETRYTSSGQKVTTLVVASNSFRNGQEETIWWRVSIWGDRFDKMLPHLTKGKLIMVGGEMRKPETYRDKSGNTQVGSIELTAEYVKFVPIGRPEGQTAAGAPAAEVRNTAPQQENNMSFGSLSSPANFSQDYDEEPLPF